MIAVYKITSPNKRIYIGSSIDIKERFASYRRLDCITQHRLYNSFLKYGVHKHKFDIICECKFENIKTIEAYYGALYNCLGRSGLNCRLPNLGEGFNRTSQETRYKIGKSKIGNKYNLGLKRTPESIEKMRIAQRNRKRLPHSLNTRITMSKAALGAKNHKAKIVLNTQTGIFYECLRDAAISYNMKYNTFRNKLFEGGGNKNNTPFIYV